MIARDQVHTHLLHHGADGGRAPRRRSAGGCAGGTWSGVDALVSEHLPELAREELTRVVVLDVADYIDRAVGL